MKVAGIIIECPEGIVVQQRDDKETITSPGQLSLFGGALEGDETPVEGILREVAEETSLKLGAADIEEIITIQINGKKKNGDNFERTYYTFVAKIDSPDFEVFEGQGAVIIHYDISTREFQKLNLNTGAATVLKHYLGVR
jgi:8-oxo-dGTP pyrophosphatase MutT (NUDIX family)